MAFDERAVAAICEMLSRSRAAATPAYLAYFDLLDAARRRDGSAVEAILARLPRLAATAPPFQARNWSAVLADAALAERYLHYVNVEPGSTVVFAPVAGDAFARTESALARGIALMEAATPLLLNADRHATTLDLVDGLAHEGAHAHLFGVSRGQAFVRNAPEERFSSPLRADPRPLDGIFHAAFVSARMHYAHDRLLASGILDRSDAEEARGCRDAGLRAFLDGAATLDRHARLTPLGAKVLAAARAYMAPFA